ncbi:MAG: CHRD domain-containing protein [Deltaproteobacteria bacterium]|nr:CHRD domain-containing protein [Deltaproteobacteria bacterium]
MKFLTTASALALSLFAGSWVAAPAAAVEVKVTIENVAPEGGTFLTPVWVGFHDGTFDSYDRNAPLRGTVERLVEDGNTGPITDEFDAGFTSAQATLPGPNGPIFPGESASMIFDVDRANGEQYFSYISMVIPSNDAFIANGNPLAHRVFDTNGVFTPIQFYVSGLAVLDGGTEVNDELPANTAAFGQAAPDTGVDENGVVTVHPGFNAPGTGGILDAPQFADANFVTPGRQLARITIEAVRTTTFSFGADASQEVPTNGSEATAACRGEVSSDGGSLTVRCDHNVADVTAAHLHQAVRGENGPVVFPFADATSPIEETFAVSEADLENLASGNFYLNIHSEAIPAGEIRGQLDTCFAGPNSLCLNDGRFMVYADWETSDATGSAKGFELTEDSGVLYFFRDSNIELDVKVLDGCSTNGRYWVFAAGLTNQGVDLMVEDTLTGETQAYNNPLGTQFQPILDTNAFATCP